MTGAATLPELGSDPLPNPRHESFARLVAVQGLSHAEAYTRAGYTSQTPAPHGARLAQSGSIAERITYLVAHMTAAAVSVATVDAHRIQAEYEAIAFSDIGDAFEAPLEGEELPPVLPRLKPVSRWPERFRRAVASIKVKRYVEGSEENAREVELLEFRLWPKVTALDGLREHMGLKKPDQLDININGVVALPILQVPTPGPGDTVIDSDADLTPDLTPRFYDDSPRAALMALLTAGKAR